MSIASNIVKRPIEALLDVKNIWYTLVLSIYVTIESFFYVLTKRSLFSLGISFQYHKSREIFRYVIDVCCDANNIYWTIPLGIYFVIEVCFYFFYRFYLVPKANVRTQPMPFPGIYRTDRVALFNRMMDRAEITCRITNRTLLDYMTEYFELLFRDDDGTGATLPAASLPNNIHSTGSVSNGTTTTASITEYDSGSEYHSDTDFDDISSCHTTDDISCSGHDVNSGNINSNTIATNDSNTNLEIIMNSHELFMSAAITGKDGLQLHRKFVHPIVKRQDANEILAFGFFSKNFSELEDWEKDQLQEMYQVCEDRVGVVFASGKTKGYTPRKITLEDVDALFRPLIVYATVRLFKAFASIIFLCMGFQRIVSKTGLVCWFRNASSDSDLKCLPYLFFHGIVPGGLGCYIPMLFNGIIMNFDDRPILMFETPYIAHTMSFDSILTKDDVVNGVIDIVYQVLDDDYDKLTVIGHSFGTFALTWLIQNDILKYRIHQICLLDPVSILLSEPDLMKNFENPGSMFFRLLGTSELFLNYYVRRHFAWYNSELWLGDDIMDHMHLIIGLAGNDTVVNASKVSTEVQVQMSCPERTASKNFWEQTRMLYWDDSLHGSVTYDIRLWSQVRNALMEQELEILRKEDQEKRDEQEILLQQHIFESTQEHYQPQRKSMGINMDILNNTSQIRNRKKSYSKISPTKKRDFFCSRGTADDFTIAKVSS